jgi:hypothetical protein
MGDVLPNLIDVLTGLLWFTFEQLLRFPVNLLVPLREPFDQFPETPSISKSPRALF